MNEQKKTQPTKWLNKLQEQSWNLELLISGFSIFGLFQLLHYIDIQSWIFVANPARDSVFYDIGLKMFFTAYYGTSIFITCLVLHVFLRGLWIGALGLRSVSAQIEYDKLNYSDKFKTYLEQSVGSFDDYINKLEKLSSTIFSLTYLLMFVLFSLILFIFEVGLIGFLKEPLDGVTSKKFLTYVSYFFYIVGAIVAFDFVTGGLLKKIKWKWFTRFYMPIYRVVSIITLSFLWRPLLYNFLDQSYTKKLAATSLVLLALMIQLDDQSFNIYKYYPTVNEEDAYRDASDYVFFEQNTKASFNPEMYDDLRKKNRQQGKYSAISKLSLPSYRVDESLFTVFIKYDAAMDTDIEAIHGKLEGVKPIGLGFGISDESDYRSAYQARYKKLITGINENHSEYNVTVDSLWKAFSKKEGQLYQAYLQKIKDGIRSTITIKINEQAIPKDSVYFDFFVHPNFEEKGVLANFKLRNTHLGTYLTLTKYHHNTTTKHIDTVNFTVPFIYTKED